MKVWTQRIHLPGSRFDLQGTKRLGYRWRAHVVLVLWLFSFPAVVAAQGWYWGSPVAPGYDRTSVVEVTGVVLHFALSPRGGGSTLRIESGGEVYVVTLGPNGYLRKQGVDINIGDKLLVKGSKTKTREGKMYLTAASVKNMRTGHILELRDENGRPLWPSKRRFDTERDSEGKP
ncbi:MAG: hypothetical protein AB2L22_07845 [Syntrophales bacterium]